MEDKRWGKKTVNQIIPAFVISDQHVHLLDQVMFQWHFYLYLECCVDQPLSYNYN